MGRRIVKSSAGAVGSHRLRWEDFEARISTGVPSVEASIGPPVVHFFIEPAGRRIGARFFAEGGSTTSSRLAEVTVRVVGVGRDTVLEVSTDNPALYRDFYSLCCSIADKVQINKEPLGSAVARSLSSLAALIRVKPLLSPTGQIGLLGELLFLQRVAAVLGWPVAADSWFGPDTEEHDFVLPAVDVEVKSTSQEQRIHHIGSLEQLSPKNSRRLYLVSVQLTKAGAGASAISLPSVIASVLASAGKAAPEAAELIRDRIRRLGWEDEDASHYQSRYHLRAPLMAIRVSDTFPAIVPETLSGLNRLAIARIKGVAYSINVDGLGVSDEAKPFNRELFSTPKSR